MNGSARLPSNNVYEANTMIAVLWISSSGGRDCIYSSIARWAIDSPAFILDFFFPLPSSLPIDLTRSKRNGCGQDLMTSKYLATCASSPSIN